MILEWTVSNTLGWYQQLLLSNASISVVPSPEVENMFIRNMSVQLTLSYNTLYDVSITQLSLVSVDNLTKQSPLN